MQAAGWLQFNFHLSRRCDRRIGSVEWAISPGRTGRCGQAQGDDWSRHGPFRKFQFRTLPARKHALVLSAAATFSRHWSKHPDGCWLSRVRPDSNNQTIHLGYKERSARTRNRGDTRDPSISRFSCFQNIKKAIATTHVNAAALGIDEQVIGITAGLGGRDPLAVRYGKDAERGRSPKDHEDLAPNVVQGHRKICTPIGQRPFSDLLLRDPVHDRDAAGTWNVDEDLAGVRVNLEGFGMRLHRNITNLAAGRRIDDRERPAAVSNEDPIRRGINAYVIGVAAELNSSRCLVIAPFKQTHRAVTSIGDIKHIGRGLIAHALGLLQFWNPADQFAIWEIDNSNGIIAQLGNEQSLPLQIDRHMVDAAAHVAQRNFGFELERTCIRGLSRSLARGASQRHDIDLHRGDYLEW